MKPPYTKWTAADAARMVEMWNAGRSASVIAAEIGKSRSAVMGKIGRMGMTRGGSRQNAIYRKFRPKPVFVPQPAPVVARSLVPPTEEPVSSPPEAPGEPAPALYRALVDLEPDDCRFPMGDPRDPAFGFCALPVTPGRPYCADHCAACYAPRPIPMRRPAR